MFTTEFNLQQNIVLQNREVGGGTVNVDAILGNGLPNKSPVKPFVPGKLPANFKSNCQADTTRSYTEAQELLKGCEFQVNPIVPPLTVPNPTRDTTGPIANDPTRSMHIR